MVKSIVGNLEVIRSEMVHLSNGYGLTISLDDLTDFLPHYLKNGHNSFVIAIANTHRCSLTFDLRPLTS